ncbi:MAG: poly-gamma-glutamate hydrolase family protein [Acidimicrobiaceae bacterium]|nr:poly-gamma-glutamate hydrolase family protein [Acidimicrobiaceae bacterium]
MGFPALIAHPGVDEVCELRGRFGLMAFHGGNLERTTDVIAHEVAQRSRSSLYAVIQHAPLREHVPSITIRPEHSARLQEFLDHVHTVIAVHGYGRETQFWNVLLGGRNRALATHLSEHLRSALPEAFGIVDDLEQIPRGLRGLHEANPVNLPSNTGVQLELPPTIRWNKQARNWSDHDGTPRAPQVDTLIDALTEAVESWTAPPQDSCS